VFGRGVGLGQGFYPSVVLAALVLGPLWGALAGFGAVVLDVSALFAHGGETWDRVFSTSDVVRLTSYVVSGAIVGYVALRGRRLLEDSLDVLENLLAFAGRDLTTAALASQGLELEIVRRLSTREPFSLVVVELASLNGNANGADVEQRARDMAALLATKIGPGDELARIGSGRFAIVGAVPSAESAHEAVAAQEQVLRASAETAAFGSAVYPADGLDTLSLFSAAMDRLHAGLGAAHP